jgi:hypothetical protein
MLFIAKCGNGEYLVVSYEPFAASIAGLMLTTEVMVTDRPIEKSGIENVSPGEHHPGPLQA